MTKNKLLIFQIFWSFFKIGPVTFGGGYAMIPFIEKEVVNRRKWVKEEDVADVFALAESAPGAIAINSAIFIGYRIGKIPGALAALLGVLTPTFSIVIVLSMLFLTVQDHPKIEAAFMSVRATVVALIVYAAIQIGKTAVVDKTTVALTLITVGILLFYHMHPVIVIISGALIGIILVWSKELITKLTKKETKEKQL